MGGKKEGGAEEERRLKAAQKKQEKLNKQKEIRNSAMRRDKAEAKITAEEDNLMVLIYPLITHRIEFFMKSNFDEEEKKFKKEIDETKAAKLAEVGGDKKKLDFDVYRDVYLKDCKNFMFELDI